jgi:tetratricopeptide (TPR) repeat protein
MASMTRMAVLAVVLASGCGAQDFSRAASEPALEPAARLVTEGNALYVKGEPDEAIARYQAVLAANPSEQQRALALRGLASSSFKKGDKAAALRWFEEYLPLSPEREQQKVRMLIAYLKRPASGSGGEAAPAGNREGR